MKRFVLVRLDDALPHAEALLSTIKGKRKEKASRFVRVEDQVRSAIAGMLINVYAGRGETKLNDHGRPYFPDGPWFSVSHGGDLIGIYVADEMVGFDVEAIDRCDTKIIPAAFTEEEAARIETQKDFAYAWTRKEAMAKCLGVGIEMPRRFGVSPFREGQYAYRAQLYFVKSMEFEGHVLCLCQRKSDEFPEMEIVSAEELIANYRFERRTKSRT